VKDTADYIRANATKIILLIYPVKIAARTRYLQQTGRGNANSSGDTYGQGRIYHMALLEDLGTFTLQNEYFLRDTLIAYFGKKS